MAPAAAELWSLDCEDVLPEAAPCVLVEDEDELGLVAPDEEPPGQEQVPAPPSDVLPDVLPLADGVVVEAVEPLVLDWLDDDVLPLADGSELELDPLVDGEVELDDDGAVPPAALEVVPDALPDPEAEVAPWFMVEDGLVVVAFWLAEAEPVDTPWLPVPRFTPAPTFAPALTSVLLMPTFASTFGFTFTPPEGAVVEPLALLGCDDCVLVEL